ncbi:MAG: hypothetical protein BZ138_02545 [Methanosphaera sp. rholeuAM270]|nr:MAG: hypothetical protein BZ138_02545 [Methanosphaera sp. rholeuAM270]
MGFDFNAWNKKWVSCKTGDPMKKYYWKKLEEAREDFMDDKRMFNEAYHDPTHIMRINDKFLDETIGEILTKEFCIPSPLSRYLIKRYPHYREDIMKIRESQWENGMLSSVNATGLKPMLANARTKEDEKRLLLFEVFEFSLTYPEYEDVFIEEIVE